MLPGHWLCVPRRSPLPFLGPGARTLTLRITFAVSASHEQHVLTDCAGSDEVELSALVWEVFSLVNAVSLWVDAGKRLGVGRGRMGERNGHARARKCVSCVSAGGS